MTEWSTNSTDKICNRISCEHRGVLQSIEKFIKNNRTKYARPECIDCYNKERRRKHSLKTEEKKLNKILKTRYKIDIDFFNFMNKKQNSCCAICRT